MNNIERLPNVGCVIPVLTSVVTTSAVRVVGIGSSKIIVDHYT